MDRPRQEQAEETTLKEADEEDDVDEDDVPLLVAVDGPRREKEQEDATTNGADSTVVLPPPRPPPPCPVTILSGFLGSGKTTLIQYILKSPDHGKRIAVIENEFGVGLAIESLIATDGANQRSLADMIELPNGCVCCTVKDSLVATLENLLAKRDDLDYILIECSGMANPGPIASLFWLDDALESRLRLDGIVTLVDAANIARQLRDTEEASQQIAYADRILLNKIDLVQSDDDDDPDTGLPAQLDRTVRSIRRFHPTAPIRRSTYSVVPDLDWIMDANCFEVDRIREVENSFQEALQSQQAIQQMIARDHWHDEGGGKNGSSSSCDVCSAAAAAAVAARDQHAHTQAVSTLAFDIPGTMDLQRVHAWLASVLWPDQDEEERVLRARVEQSDEDKKTATVLEAGHDRGQRQQQQQQQIFRIKGILSVFHSDDSSNSARDDLDPSLVDDDAIDRRRYIVQAVHDLWEIHPAGDALQWDPDEERSCKLVVIGKFLQNNDLRQGFQSCLVDDRAQ